MKRLFINLPPRFAFALRNPGYLIKSLLREALGTDERFLAAISSSKLKAMSDYLDEPFRDTKFYSHLRESEPIFREAKITSADFYAKKVALQYALVRATKPEIILETASPAAFPRPTSFWLCK